jgi:hypothetical protein
VNASGVGSRRTIIRYGWSSEPDDFFAERDAELILDGRLAAIDERGDVGGRRGAGIDDEVGVQLT